MATQTEEQKKAEKAEKERQRKATIKAAKDALVKAGLDPEATKLDLDQRKRAAESAEKKAGLAGKALATYILEGKGTAEQVNDAKAERQKADRQEAQRQNLTRSTDPEAAELAQAAAAIVSVGPKPVRSAFLPKEGRQFLDVILPQTGDLGALGLLERLEKNEETGAQEAVKVTQAALRGFTVDADGDKEVRKHLTALRGETILWGRKLGAFIMARIEQEKKNAKK
jgi:hypothetical protein